MKILISPAKSLDYTSLLPTAEISQPEFLTEAEELNAALRLKRPPDLQVLMGISEKLAAINWERNQDFVTPFTADNARPAVFAFNGDVYTGLDAHTLDGRYWSGTKQPSYFVRALWSLKTIGLDATLSFGNGHLFWH